MSAAMTATAPANSSARLSWTLNITGATATTAYIVDVTGPTGAHHFFQVTTDGTGAASVKYTPMTAGSFSATLRPKAEYQGTTSATASLSATTVNPFN